jgi:riboflavin synthase
MFTGIIEATGLVKSILPAGSGKVFWIESSLAPELRTDQSISHNGVCLTVEEIKGEMHRVTAVEETLKKTNLGSMEPGNIINLERGILANCRLDGHLVQGHVDTTGVCLKRKEKNGSWEFSFEFAGKFAPLIIEKGSICLNGISLTVYNVKRKKFSVSIIPYTFDHTNFRSVKPGDTVNLEFDLVGKYLVRSLSLKEKN